VRKPETLPDSYPEKLDDSDESEFWDLYRDISNNLDDESASRLVRSTFRSRHQPQFDVFSAIKDAFHPDNSDGYSTGYEVSFTNPLYEIRENPASLLLTDTNWKSVNFCFVVCETSGEEHGTWPNRINEIHDLVTGHKDHLISQVDEDGKDINHIQYVSCVPKQEIPDIDTRFLLRKAAPDDYALWVVDDDYSPSQSETNPPPVELRHEAGKISHSQLRGPIKDGIDYGKAINRDISIQIETHPLISLQEVLMTLITNNYGVKDEPREFNHSDFVDTFIDLCEVGPSGDSKRELLEDRAQELIDTAKDASIVYYDNSDRIKGSHDYRARYGGSGTKKLRDSIKSKYISSQIPERKRELAYERARNQHDPENGVQSGVDAQDWED